MERNDSLTFDRFFKSNDIITQQIIFDIIVDRKFNIPESFYPYVTTNVMITLIKAYKNTTELMELLVDICKNDYFDSYYFGLRLMEEGLMGYAFLLKPKVFLKLFKKFYSTEDCDIAHQMIGQFINKEGLFEVIDFRIQYVSPELPIEYFYCLALVYDIDYTFKPSISNIYSMLTKIVKNKLFEYKPSIIDTILVRAYELFIYPAKEKDDNTLWRRDFLFNCWNNGHNFIPDNITEFELLQYLKIHDTRFKTVEYPDNISSIVNRVIGESTDQHMIDIIEQKIIRSITHNFNNIKAITWELDSSTLSCIRHLYKNSQMPLNNYRYYHDIMINNMDVSPYITFKEYSYFITVKSGKEIDENILSIYDYDEYVNFILTALPDDVICEKFIYDDKIPTYKHDGSGPSILQYIIDNYIIPNENSRLIDKVLKLIFPNNDILDIVVSKYASIMDLINRSGKDLQELLVIYPNLSIYVENLPRIIAIQTIRRNLSAVRDIPIALVPSEFILDEIKRNGYFKLHVADEGSILDQPIPYIPTDKLLEIISANGNGIGYCIEYRLEEYINTVLEAIYSIYESKYSIS